MFAAYTRNNIILAHSNCSRATLLLAGFCEWSLLEVFIYFDDIKWVLLFSLLTCCVAVDR
eukprot:m.93902 g.93902  ORF g.93902 m.93902 type:complete len:60 (+) comp12400_c0_seq7:1027-1206(+)